MMLKQKDIGEFCKVALCPKCSDTKFVKEFSRVSSSIGTFIAYTCSQCMIGWEGLSVNVDTIKYGESSYDYRIRKYMESHKYCPSCKNLGPWSVTCKAINVDVENIYDTNTTSCPKCNWFGRIHDLVGDNDVR